MPYKNINSIPQALKTAGLTLAQANYWASIYDGAKGQKGVTSPAAAAWKIFKKKYYKIGKVWKMKKNIRVEKKVKTEKSSKALFNPLIDNKIKIKIKETIMKKEKVLKGYEFVYRDSKKPTSLEDANAEGKLYEKELIREGSWVHPQNTNMKLKITLDRLKKWVANFNKNLFKVPVPKRHSLDPEDNRGWVKELSIKKNDNGKSVLFGKLDITNNKMQTLIDNGDIQDVSVSVAPYMDNQGKKHGEALQHVALTVIPHIDSQAGFNPISAEGYLCLEESKEAESQIINNQAPRGSDEEFKEILSDAIVIARIFPDEKSFYIVGTFNDKVIVQYYGGGTGDTGTLKVDRYFEIPYTKNLKGNFIFGNKEELTKEYYFTPTKYIQEPTVGAEKNKKKEKKEVDKMELEELQEKHDKLEEEKVNLEAKVAEIEPKIAELEKEKVDLEASNKAMKEQLDKIEAEKKAAFEKETDDKVSKLVEKGNILPAEKEDIKAVLLEGGKAATMLEVTLKDRKAVPLGTKTEQTSDKPSKGGELRYSKEIKKIN